MTRQGQCTDREECLSSVNDTHFGGHQSFCLSNCLRSKNTLKTRKGFWIFETDSWTHVLGKLEKVIQKVVERHGIWRAQKSTNPVLGFFLNFCLAPRPFYMGALPHRDNAITRCIRSPFSIITEEIHLLAFALGLKMLWTIVLLWNNWNTSIREWKGSLFLSFVLQFITICARQRWY